MQFSDLIRISLRQVIRQRRRNIGVFFAIALGTAGLIVIITMSEDVKSTINRDLELMGGATRMKVDFESANTGRIASRPNWFRDETLEAIRQMPGVDSVSLAARRLPYATAIRQDQRYPFLILAVDDKYARVNDYVPAAGRFFTEEDIKDRLPVCILGENLARTIFGDEPAVGKKLLIEGDYFQIVGIMGGVTIRELTDWALLPITTARARLQAVNSPNIAYIRCKTWDDVEPIAKQVPQLIAEHQPTDNLRVTVQRGPLKQIKRMTYWIELFSYVAVAATLLLGGFGIWNITMSSVLARTREIGLKKAMGAEDQDILAQFLAEALGLSLGAAVFGIILGRIIMEVVSNMLNSQPAERMFLLCVGQGLLFSVLLGAGAGLYPSIRASRMEVVTALRYE